MISHRAAICHDIDLSVYYPEAHVIDGDSLVLRELLLQEQNAVVVFRRIIPSEELIKKSKIPIVIFTRSDVPEYVEKLCHVTDARTNIFIEASRWLKGERISPDPNVQPVLLWSLIKQNAFLLWPSGVPKEALELDEMASNYQTDYFYDVLNTLRPESYPPIKWRKAKKEDVGI